MVIKGEQVRPISSPAVDALLREYRALVQFASEDSSTV